MLQVKKYIMPLLISLSLFAGGCAKEEMLEPSREEAPKFFVESEFNNAPYNMYSGKNEYRAESFTQYAKIGFVTFCMYNSVLTNGNDTFQVGLPDFQFGVTPSKETLDNLLTNLSKNNGNQYVNFPGVFIRIVRDGNVYSVVDDPLVQQDSYFNILKIEDYSPKGETLPMKKAEVEFKCVLQNEMNMADTVHLTNGRATLLFSYKF